MRDVTGFLEEAGIDFEVRQHARTERAADEATALGIGAEDVGKTLVLVAPSGNVRAVLPASERIDLHKVAAVVGPSAARRCIWRVRTTLRATILTSSSAPYLRSAAARIR